DDAGGGDGGVAADVHVGDVGRAGQGDARRQDRDRAERERDRDAADGAADGAGGRGGRGGQGELVGGGGGGGVGERGHQVGGVVLGHRGLDTLHAVRVAGQAHVVGGVDVGHALDGGGGVAVRRHPADVDGQVERQPAQEREQERGIDGEVELLVGGDV